MPLSAETAMPVEPGSAPLTRREMLALLPEVPEWTLENGRLWRRFSFRTVGEATAFINRVIEIGSKSGADHYPDIVLSQYRHVDVLWYNYACGGLTRTDFVLAAKLSGMTAKKGLFR
ncbi:4a-hydroxytetrahydrobiopterin dehydratase [Methanofollis aquaemaris]|uniref:4a-hydroxytetrahydrobiopterin dehydratase n=1 Tax=Methanofollis aquaemaris TaxID=126734 RepID=A0A8A3S7M3_9EURY|nr:4a-hydroxytetrahydrobiopterin dehydratase [Methanofollis aquaemaris]QSZ67606.1 4a-hydroxytetrahydrobiopterin dehydratase [Methanofollis aquaemaris]